MAEMAYLKAAEAGLDVMDCALPLQGTSCTHRVDGRDVRRHRARHELDLERLTHLADYFAAVRKKYAAFEGNVQVDAGVLLHQVPGGMISNLVSQLREQGAADKLRNVLGEIPAVRADLGYPPLVTPTSQIVGTQAVLNAPLRRALQASHEGTRGLALGQYGQTPAAITDEVRKLAPDAEPITARPADSIKARVRQGAAGGRRPCQV